MKTPVAANWITGLVLAMAWLPGGLAQTETKGPPALRSDAAPVATPPKSPSAPSSRVLTSPLEASAPGAIALSNDIALKDRRPPSKIKLSPWVAEIVKLAEARIEDDVMFLFIENSGTFNLGTDQIVYLSDLGVSSQIISAMLQHDQDLISGAKPLTIASEPAWEPVLPTPMTNASDDSKKTSAQPVTVPTASVPVAVPTPAPPTKEPSSESQLTLPAVQLTALDSAVIAEHNPPRPAALNRQPVADKKKSLYPVRESQAVELTAPIIFLEGTERTANTIIIVGFPRNEPPAP